MTNQQYPQFIGSDTFTVSGWVKNAKLSKSGKTITLMVSNNHSLYFIGIPKQTDIKNTQAVEVRGRIGRTYQAEKGMTSFIFMVDNDNPVHYVRPLKVRQGVVISRGDDLLQRK